jgi:hypothetical protein
MEKILVSLITIHLYAAHLTHILISPQSQLNHKNAHCRESIIYIISKLHDIFGDDVAIVADLPLKLIATLHDQQPAVRQIAFDTLVKLKGLYGESMLV